MCTAFTRRHNPKKWLPTVDRTVRKEKEKLPNCQISFYTSGKKKKS